MEDMEYSLDDLIVSYLAGDLDAGEERELLDRLEVDPEAKARYESLHDVWQAAGYSAGAGKYDAAQAFETFRQNRMASSRPVRRWTRIVRIAAAAAAVAVVALLTFQIGRRSIQRQFAPICVEAPQYATTTVNLPDGSKIQLNSCSSITYSQGFGVEDREVRISGEACFEVAHDEALPFMVSSDHLRVKVLGTRFNFRDYPDDREAVVSLLEGRLSLADPRLAGKTEKFLSPGQRAILEKQSGIMRIDSKDVSRAMYWTQGRLFFDEVTLHDIVRELERCYDVKITVADAGLDSLRIYGDFHSREQRVEDILDLLASTQNFKYSKNGREIRIF